MKTNNWLVIGIQSNWETALSQPIPIWGLKTIHQKDFQILTIGDILWFYVTNPVGGIIGLGTVKDKYIDSINCIWKEELIKKSVIWPYRFRIQVLKVLPRSFWTRHKIRINDFKIFWQKGFHLLNDYQTNELFNRAMSLFDRSAIDQIYKGSTITTHSIPASIDNQINEPKEIYASPHREVQNDLAEIGKLQFYYSELEYPINSPNEKKNIDVVWKREIDGVPTFAFEIEFSDSIEKSIERLQIAFKRWSARPRLIIENSYLQKTQKIISSYESSFSQNLKIYEPLQIKNLLSKKRELRSIENKLGLY